MTDILMSCTCRLSRVIEVGRNRSVKVAILFVDSPTH